MIKKILTIFLLISLQVLNAYAGSDGETTLSKKKSEQVVATRDCFEKLNRATLFCRCTQRKNNQTCI
jgi:hypothetical protein